jgi:thioredoxin-related protein
MLTQTRFLLLLLSVAASVCLADPPSGYTFLPFDEGMRKSQTDQQTMLVYFGRHGCGFCDKTNREAFSDSDVRERLSAHYVLIYVDSEGGRRLTLPSGERIVERDLGPLFQAFVTPVFVFLEPGGTTILKRAGVHSARELLAYDDYVQGGHYRDESLMEFLRDRL